MLAPTEPPVTPPMLQILMKDGSITDIPECKSARFFSNWLVVEFPTREKGIWNRDVIAKIKIGRNCPLQGSKGENP